MLIAETMIPADPSLTQMITFSALGFVIVMSVLLFQSALTAFIGKIFINLNKKNS